VTELELLTAWCRDRDAFCPRCGYNLRNTSSPNCPECGLALGLGVVNPVPRVGPMVLAMVSVALAAGFSLTLAVVGWVGLWRQSKDPRQFSDWGRVDWVAIGFLSAHAVLSLFTLRVIYVLRGRIQRWRRSRQWTAAVVCLLLAVAAEAALIYAVFAVITHEWEIGFDPSI
jgi:hypothetical protein